MASWKPNEETVSRQRKWSTVSVAAKKLSVVRRENWPLDLVRWRSMLINKSDFNERKE